MHDGVLISRHRMCAGHDDGGEWAGRKKRVPAKLLTNTERAALSLTHCRWWSGPRGSSWVRYWRPRTTAYAVSVEAGAAVVYHKAL
jgi:hypothetical protein